MCNLQKNPDYIWVTEQDPFYASCPLDTLRVVRSLY